jgi:hypothetical protein
MTKDVDDLLIERLTVGFPLIEAAYVRREARKRGMSLSAFIRGAVYAQLDGVSAEINRLPALAQKRRSG